VKKILILVAIMSLLMLSACMTQDTKNKLQQTNAPSTNPVPENPGTTTDGGIGGTDTTTGGGIVTENIVSIYSSETGLKDSVVINDWNSGATLTEEINYAGKAKVYKIMSGNGWGAPVACVAFQELGDYQVTYSYISFKIKSADLSKVTVKIPNLVGNGGVEKEYDIATGMLVDGWYELKIKLSDHKGTENVGATQIGIHGGWDKPGTFYITDVCFSN